MLVSNIYRTKKLMITLPVDVLAPTRTSAGTVLSSKSDLFLLLPWFSVTFSVDQGPFHNEFCHHNSNSMENWFWCNCIVRHHIATKFQIHYNSTTVVPHAKFHINHFTTSWMREEWNFHIPASGSIPCLWMHWLLSRQTISRHGIGCVG